MKANLNELRELVLFTEDCNNSFFIAVRHFMFCRVTEPVQQGDYDLGDEFKDEDLDFSFANKDKLLVGFDFLEYVETDFNEDYVITF